jgi:crotonobetainyl-CoA:carnitine CoA-transferase CaiB-like acyl-CoA transferase
VAIAAGASNAVWTRFCEIIGRADLARDPRFATAAARRDRRDEIAAIIAGWTGQRTRAGVVDTLARGGVPAAPVNDVAEMIADPQVRAREMFVEVEHPMYGPLTTTGTPIKMSETPGRIRWLAPEPGAHNEEVFVGMLGHSREDLARWQAEGVI